MKKDPSQMTNEERWDRVGELLYKGVYLLAMQEGQQMQPTNNADHALITLQEAAQLAAYYCKKRADRKIDVDYTQRKYVRRVKGGEPGTVIFSQNKTIYVEREERVLKRLLDGESEAQKF